MNNGSANIQQFFESKSFGVVGASANREKYGNKVFRCYLQHNKDVFPINLNESSIEGVATIASVLDLPASVKSISIITPPHVTENVVEEAIQAGIKNIWMQPGAESAKAIRRCIDSNINVIGDGSCILVVLGYKEQA